MIHYIAVPENQSIFRFVGSVNNHLIDNKYFEIHRPYMQSEKK